jgi:uncharacterized protein
VGLRASLVVIARRFVLVLAAAICLAPAASARPKLPERQGFVSDFAEKLSPDARQALEARLQDFRSRSGGIELVVVTIPYDSMGGLPIEKYSLQLARTWGIGGGKGKDGLLLLIAIKPSDEYGIYHGSTRIEVSRSLEREVPPPVASMVIGSMHDDFVAGRFDQAINAGVQAIMETVAGKRGFWQPVPTPSPTASPVRWAPASNNGLGGIWEVVLGIFGGGGTLVVILVIVMLVFGTNRGPWGSAGPRWYRYGRNQPYWQNNQQDMASGNFQQSSDVPGVSDAPQGSFDAASMMGGSDSGGFSSGGSDFGSSSGGGDLGTSSGGGGDFGGGGATGNF